MARRGPSIVPFAPLPPDVEVGESELHYENHTVDDIYARLDRALPPDMRAQVQPMVLDLLRDPPTSESELGKRMVLLRRKYPLRKPPKKLDLLKVYNEMVANKECEPSPKLRDVLTAKAAKSQSGVLVITVLTSPTPTLAGGRPQNFSCRWDCHYCPNQPGQPRSYLRDEPAVRRANQNQFDPILQFTDRGVSLAQMGHPIDKVELLVLGGTWHSYPLEYQEVFVRDLFYAANTFMVRSPKRRAPKSLEEEQRENESAACKIIGLTLETRPDCIDADELRRLRRYGCTRVQLGLQHTDDGILMNINRGHDVAAAVQAIRLLKDSCYKMDIHLMPNLPGSSVKIDEAMFHRVLYDPDLQVDQWKIYPTEVTPWTKIRQWYEEGSYVPYDEETLAKLLARVKAKVHPWIRLNRVIRDIPKTYILGGLENVNLREMVLAEMGRNGSRCRCIRCREVGDIGGFQLGAEQLGGGKRLGNREGIASRERGIRIAQEAELTIRQYEASGGTEYFISYESSDEILCGFCRLRLSERKYFPEGLFPELLHTALIRELHVYGQLIPTSQSLDSNAQHVGFGKNLMAEAEAIALDNGFTRIAVIAGIGTRNYYRKLGYELQGEGGFLIKELNERTRLPRPPCGHQRRPLPGKFLVYRWVALLVALVAWYLTA